MTEIIMTTICVGIVSSVISLFFGDNGELSKYIKLVLSLSFLCALLGGGKKLASEFDISSQIPFIETDFDITSVRNNYYEEISKQMSADLETN